MEKTKVITETTDGKKWEQVFGSRGHAGSIKSNILMKGLSITQRAVLAQNISDKNVVQIQYSKYQIRSIMLATASSEKSIEDLLVEAEEVEA